MTILKAIMCDSCGKTFQMGYHISNILAEKMLRKAGWSVGRYRFCPDCKTQVSKQLRKQKQEKEAIQTDTPMRGQMELSDYPGILPEE